MSAAARLHPDTARSQPGRLRAGVVAAAAVLVLGGLLPDRSAHAASASQTAPAAQAPASTWWQQFDDPVLTALLAPLGARDPERAQALARQWVAVRVYHLQGAVADALGRMARAEQAALMDLPAEAPERDAQLARVAEQLAKTQRFTADRVRQRDQAIAAVAQLTGEPAAQLLARMATPLAEGRLPHLVAEPPTVRVTLSAHTSEQAQRLTALHACHEAARQADRAVLAARQALAQASARAPAVTPGDGAGTGDAPALPTDAATARATQALLLAMSSQAAAAGDLAIAWLDYLAVAPAPAAAGAGHTATRGGARPA